MVEKEKPFFAEACKCRSECLLQKEAAMFEGFGNLREMDLSDVYKGQKPHVRPGTRGRRKSSGWRRPGIWASMSWGSRLNHSMDSDMHLVFDST